MKHSPSPASPANRLSLAVRKLPLSMDCSCVRSQRMGRHGTVEAAALTQGNVVARAYICLHLKWKEQ